MFCPDEEDSQLKMGDFIFQNQDGDRQVSYIEFEIRKCNPERNPEGFCHAEEEIESWLSHSTIDTWYI